MNITEIKEELERIECDLSPENLTCDGELSGTPLRKKMARLLKRRAQFQAKLDKALK